MEKITYPSSAYLVYELKGFNFLILEYYGVLIQEGKTPPAIT